MEVRVISWNLLHGRDAAPDGGLHTWRSRLLRRIERGETHAQVNRDLFPQFCRLLADASWDIALLQECPPRWAERLGAECRAEPHLVLTSRNLPPPLQRLQHAAARWNPDLIGSWEGGSNLTLIRSRDPHTTVITERRALTLTRRPETRRMAFTHLRPGLCLANLHASTSRAAAELEIAAAARAAERWSGGLPLILAGDFNLRPLTSMPLFTELRDRHGLAAPTGPEAIDHVLARGLEVIEPATAWPPGRREVPDPTASDPPRALPVRLSDHAPVEATFELPKGQPG